MPSKTSSPKLSREDFDALLRLSETATAITGMTELLRMFPSNCKKILASGAFSEEQHALTVVPLGSDQEKDVEWNDDVGGYAYFSLRGWVKIDANLLRRYKLNAQWVVDQILQALSWPQKAEPLLDGMLWNCGQSYIGKKRVSLFVGRRVAHPEVFSDIQKKLTPRCKSGANVLLTTSQHIEPHMSIPGATIVPLFDVFNRQRKNFALDADLISSILFDQRPGESNKAVLCKANGGKLIINGRSFEFRGDKQRQVVRYLCNKYDVDELPVRIQEMFSDLEFSDNTRMQDLFKKHPDWKEAIRVSRGSCDLITT